MFNKYSSIKNIKVRKNFKKVVENLSVDAEFTVTEKIHGANFSVYYYPKDDVYKFASRRQFRDNFYNSAFLVPKLNKQVHTMYSEYVKQNPEIDIERFVVYGEYYGQGIQKGVQYFTGKSFTAFDILVNDVYMRHTDAVSLFEKAGMEHQEILFKGSLIDCSKFSDEFVTLKGRENGFDDGNNICEGIVIKLNEPENCNIPRTIFKSKNDKFSEKVQNKTKKTKTSKELSVKELELLQNLLQLVNLNRLRNVVSQVGFEDMHDFGKVLKEFRKDVIKDFPDEFDNAEYISDKLIKMLTASCATLMKEAIEQGEI